MFWNRRRPKDDLIGGKKVRSIHNSRLLKPHLIEQYLKSKSQYPNVSELKLSIPGKYNVPISNDHQTLQTFLPATLGLSALLFSNSVFSRASLEPHIAMVHEGVRKKCSICNKVSEGLYNITNISHCHTSLL